jgi:hypothetical protein
MKVGDNFMEMAQEKVASSLTSIWPASWSFLVGHQCVDTTILATV